MGIVIGDVNEMQLDIGDWRLGIKIFKVFETRDWELRIEGSKVSYVNIFGWARRAPPKWPNVAVLRRN